MAEQNYQFRIIDLYRNLLIIKKFQKLTCKIQIYQISLQFLSSQYKEEEDGSLIYERIQTENIGLDQKCDCKFLFETLRDKYQCNQQWINRIYNLITTVKQVPEQCRNYLQQLKSNKTEILFNYLQQMPDQKINEDRFIIYHPEILKIRYSQNQQQIPLRDLYKENQSKYCFIFNCSSEKNHIIQQKQNKKEDYFKDKKQKE